MTGTILLFMIHLTTMNDDSPDVWYVARLGSEPCVPVIEISTNLEHSEPSAGMRTPEDLIGVLLNRFRVLHPQASVTLPSYFAELTPVERSHMRVYQVTGNDVPTMTIPFFSDYDLCERIVASQ